MDIESLKSLGWLLLWGAAFFAMMRFGCGTHGAGGHGRHGGHGRGAATVGGKARDPVCGMEVNPHNAAASLAHGGQTYYFCSANCHDRFAREPEKYLAPAGRGGHHG